MDFREQLERMRRVAVPDEVMRQREEQARAEAKREEDITQRRQRRERLDASGIALDAESLRLVVRDELEETIALRSTRAWLAGIKPAFVLVGGKGAGKTTAAAYAIARRGGVAVKARVLARRFASSWSTEVERWERLVDAPLVVIEELGTEPDETGQAALFELIDERQSASKRTLIVSNLTEAQARSRFDERTLSRLRHAQWLELPPQLDMRERPRR